MKKWEYTTEPYHISRVDNLNLKGLQGWELVCVTSIPESGVRKDGTYDYYPVAFFKREIK